MEKNHIEDKKVEVQTQQKPSEIVLTEKLKQKSAPLLTVIHFNDVYDIQSKQGSLGFVNFKAKVTQLKQLYPQALILFSGDCFSPSTLTNIKGGWQMVHCLNTLNIDAACYGNHQFDFQRQHTMELANACNFPWLMGNIHFIESGAPLGEGKPYVIKQVNGQKVGIIGVAGEDWIGILSDQYENQIQYEDSAIVATRLAKHLREVQKCDIVICLTHQRNDADIQFPKRVHNIDLVLGGHDHVIMQQLINQTAVIKSGTNFNNVGLIHLYDKSVQTSKKGRFHNYQWTIFKISIALKVDLEIQKYVKDLMEEYQKFDQIIGYTDLPLQTRFQVIRTSQSNYGNFMCDLARLYYDANLVAINSGSIRNDYLIPAGKLSYSKISNIINSPLIVKKMTGRLVLKMLQYSVAAMPGFSGAFLMVSGMNFEFDWKKTPKIVRVVIGDSDLDEDREYTIVTTLYQGKGGDGYEMFKECPTIVDEIKGITTLNLLLKFFKAPDSHQEYESIKILSKKQSISDNNADLPDFPIEHLKLVKKPSVRIGRIKELRSRFVLNDDGVRLTSICPENDGRIKCLTIVDDQKAEKKSQQQQKK